MALVLVPQLSFPEEGLLSRLVERCSNGGSSTAFSQSPRFLVIQLLLITESDGMAGSGPGPYKCFPLQNDGDNSALGSSCRLPHIIAPICEAEYNLQT